MESEPTSCRQLAENRRHVSVPVNTPNRLEMVQVIFGYSGRQQILPYRVPRRAVAKSYRIGDEADSEAAQELTNVFVDILRCPSSCRRRRRIEILDGDFT